MGATIFFQLILSIQGPETTTIPAGRFDDQQQCQEVGQGMMKEIETTAESAGVQDLRVSVECRMMHTDP